MVTQSFLLFGIYFLLSLQARAFGEGLVWDTAVMFRQGNEEDENEREEEEKEETAHTRTAVVSNRATATVIMQGTEAAVVIAFAIEKNNRNPASSISS